MNEKLKKTHIKNKKIKKDKISLDSPFAQEWPPLDFKLYTSIVDCFEAKLSRLCREARDKTPQPARKKKTISFRFKVNLDKEMIIPGFNAVMRALEKDKLSCVLVNAHSKPDFLIKSFIPVCKLNSVPLIPVKCLSVIVSRRVGIKGCLALGFTKTACKKNNHFHELYTKCCTALGYDFSSDMECDDVENVTPELNTTLIVTQPISSQEAKSYHLVRQHKYERVFKPPKRELNVSNVLSQDLSYIKIKETELNGLHNSQLHKEKKARENEASVQASEITFFLDTGDVYPDETENLASEADSRKTPDLSIIENSSSTKASVNKKKKKKLKDLSYVSANIKRTKSNPKRK